MSGVGGYNAFSDFGEFWFMSYYFIVIEGCYGRFRSELL